MSRTRKTAEPVPCAAGDFIQLHPGLDRWMMGDRYAEVIGLAKATVIVRYERSGQRGRVPFNGVLRVELPYWERLDYSVGGAQ